MSNFKSNPSGSPRFWKVVGSLSSWSKVVYYTRRTYLCRWESMTSSQCEPTIRQGRVLNRLIEWTSIDSGFVSKTPPKKNYFFRFTTSHLKFPFLYEVRREGLHQNWRWSSRWADEVLFPWTSTSRCVQKKSLTLILVHSNMSFFKVRLKLEWFRSHMSSRFSPFRRVNINSTKTKHQRSTGTYTKSNPIQSKAPNTKHWCYPVFQ